MSRAHDHATRDIRYNIQYINSHSVVTRHTSHESRATTSTCRVGGTIWRLDKSCHEPCPQHHKSTSKGRARNPVSHTGRREAHTLRCRQSRVGAWARRSPRNTRPPAVSGSGSNGRLQRSRVGIGARQPVWVAHTQPAGDDGGAGRLSWRRRRHQTCAPTRPMARPPHGERKDALDTVVRRRSRRCRARVASVAAVAAAASFRITNDVGVKPPAEAPHSAPVAPRGALRRRHRLRTCTARAHSRHRSVRCIRPWSAVRARTGPAWVSERISSIARARHPDALC